MGWSNTANNVVEQSLEVVSGDGRVASFDHNL
jgi:hypothetical protein